LLDIRQTLSDERSTSWQDMERIKNGGWTLILSTQGAFVVFILARPACAFCKLLAPCRTPATRRIYQ
jgi:hypothetical protein